MGKIYVNQSSLKIILNTGVDLTTATTLQMGYKKPDDTVGYWTAQIQGTEGIYYNFVNDELNLVGTWAFWAYITFSDLRKAPSEPVNIKVYEQGT